MAARGGLVKAMVEKSDTITDEDIVDKVLAAADAGLRGQGGRGRREQFTPFMRMVLLQSIDSHWREHLAALDYLRQGIHLRGYAQKNPKQEYKREAFELFGQLLDVVKMEVTRILMTVRIQSQEQRPRPPRRSRRRPSQLPTSPTPTPTRTAASQEADPATLGRGPPRSAATTPAPAAAARSTRTASRPTPPAGRGNPPGFVQ
jgi:preprotein translocase subunit SecA